VADLNSESTKLNDVAPDKVKETKKKIELEYDSKLALKNLSEVQVNQWYRVLISGRLTSGALFGAKQEIQIKK
jgi:hypothetical protein